MPPHTFSGPEWQAITNCPHRPFGVCCPLLRVPGYSAGCMCPRRTSAGACTCFLQIHLATLEDSAYLCGGCGAGPGVERRSYP